jgi:predicted ATPase
VQVCQRSLLMLFDNCEHVIEPAAQIVSRLLATSPRVAVLATSREPLRIDGEHVVAVPALALAPVDAIERGDSLRFPATRLFVDRIRAGKPTFEPTAAETATIARMCRRLDGMPLALELAAGRVPALGVDQVAARLYSGLKILSGGPRSAAHRHHTLQATLAWSHDLLAAAEQLVFRRLAVFSNTFTLPAAEAVLGSPGLSDWDIVDAIESLVSKSMLVAEDEGGGVRYRMLETTKAYALERLSAAAEADALAHALARHIGEVCREAEREYRSLDSVTWLKRYVSELPNLRASLEWDFGPAGDPRRGVETVANSWPIWLETLPVEGQTWLGRCEPHIDELATPLLKAQLWMARGSLLPAVRVPEVAESFRRAALAFRDLHDERRLGEALLGLGIALSMNGRPEQAHPILVEARSLIEHVGAPASLAACLQSLALASHLCGRHDESRSLHEAALWLCRSIGPSRRAATTLLNLGNLSYNMGDLDAAIACTSAAAEQLRGWGGSSYHLAFALGNLSGFQIARGELDAACTSAAEALPLLMSAGIVFWFFDHLAALAARMGDGAAAARFLGYSEVAYARQNDCRQPTQQKAYERASTIVHAQVDAARLQSLFLVGRSWTADQAASAAQAFLRQCRTEARPPDRDGAAAHCEPARLPSQRGG